MRLSRWILPTVAGLTLVAATAGQAATDEEKRAIVLGYSARLAAAYAESVETAQLLAKAVDTFLAAPTADGLTAARQAWIAARGPYLLTEIGRFYAGPIDDAQNIEQRLNAWPIDAQFIESGPQSLSPGLLNDATLLPEITPRALARLNARQGEKNISCGWHAAEFILWGRDTDPKGPGARPVTDFTAAPDAERRREFLRSCVSLIVADLQRVADSWRDSASGYRHTFESQPVDDSLGNIFTALYQLAGFELADERLLISCETRAQEDEPDCFSDTSSADFPWGLRALRGTYHGELTLASGRIMSSPGLRLLIAESNPDMATHLDEKLAAAIQQAAGLPHPFDQAILAPDSDPQKQALLTLGDTLDTWADLIAHAARAMDYDVNIEHHEEGDGR
jgi:putative iron-regulated protein